MIRNIIVWCLLVPLLCVFAAGLVVFVLSLASMALSVLFSLWVIQWGEKPWNRKYG